MNSGFGVAEAVPAPIAAIAAIAASRPCRSANFKRMPQLPHFDLETSDLLRELVDGTVAQVWEFWGPGEYPDSKTLKAEADKRTEEVLRTWSDQELATFAKTDRWSQVGLAQAGAVHPGDDPVQHVRRRLAMRVVELGLEAAAAELRHQAFGDPIPEQRVFVELPEAWEALSKRDFLMPLTPDRAPSPLVSADPYFEFGDFALFPHPRLRGMRELFRDLCELAQDERLSVQVAIDPFRIVPRERLPMMLLEDYWFGMQVTAGNLDSVSAEDLGATFHARNTDTPEGEVNDLFYPLIGTWFRWSKRDETVKILQIDEVRPPGARRQDAIVARYLHSERDTAKKVFTHLDGAVKLYDGESYPANLAKPTAKLPKAAKYRKLFRVDGEIPDADWAMAVGHFFRGNELIAEHLGELVDERAEAR